MGQLSFGWLAVSSLVITLVLPRPGALAHFAIWVVACLFDQMRIQPQILAIAVMLGASAANDLRWIARWFLAALWIWAGLHKLLSPDWHGEQSWALAELLGLNPASTHQAVAVTAAAYELVLGACALVRPRWAIALSIPMHIGIACLLSPLVANWNHTVIPWNLATASVGSWLLWNAKPTWPQSRLQLTTLALFLVAPAGFYMGWIDHHLAFVLYSDNVPRGLITTSDGCFQIETQHELSVVFPYERRLIRQYFERTARPGWKLHVADPRRWLSDQFFVYTEPGRSQPTTLEEFQNKQSGAVEGLLYDDHRSIFQLSKAGARLLKRHAGGVIYAVEFEPSTFRPALLSQLAGLPNCEQIQLRDCLVNDRNLPQLPRLNKLVAIGLAGTDVSDAALSTLRQQPHLRFVEAERTNLTPEALADAGFN